ncbi:MAG: hypothetical protein LBF82_02495 [Lactobacillales bacterium]|nr:hypothetical protein [Lactobacillales bacterium]
MKNLKKFILAFLAVITLLTVSNAVYADPNDWEWDDDDEHLLSHVIVDTYHQHINSFPITKFKIPLTEGMRTNISQYLGVSRTEFSNLHHLVVTLNEDSGNVGRESREMLLRPQQVFFNQIPEVFATYSTTDVRVYVANDDNEPILNHFPTPHTTATPHTDFDIGAFVNIDARVFSLGQVADLVRYDREYVNYHPVLSTPHDENDRELPERTHWTFGRSPNNCHLHFQSDDQPRAVLSFVNFNGGPVGTINGRGATGLTPVSNVLTLNILTPLGTGDYINDSIEPSLSRDMSMQEKWKTIFLNLFRRNNISAEVMHHLLGFSVAELEDQPLAITPAPLRGASPSFAVATPVIQSPVSQSTSTVVTPSRRPISTLNPSSWSMSSGVPSLDEETLEVFRLYNHNNGMHHYTMSRGEVVFLASLGWRDEGVAFRCSAGGVPVYRLYNPNSGIHHFTINANEKDALVLAGWQYEDIAWYAQLAGIVPVYRIYNPTNGEHVWTTNPAEVENAVAHGWSDEGIAWYIM